MMADENAGDGERDWQERRRQLQDAVERHMIRYVGDFPRFFVERAEGSYFYDDGGRRILDFTSGQMCATLGHNHPAVVGAIRRSCERAIHLFSWILAPEVVELCRELAGLLPPQLQKVILLNTGSEANEAAIRMAKLATGGHEVVALSASFHGLTGGAGAATYSVGRRGYGPAIPGSMAIPAPNAYRCPIRHCTDGCDLSCLEVGFEQIDSQRSGQPAAAIAEPILSTGGVIVPPRGYFPRLKELCEARGMLLILDEAQTAFGRVGANFAFEQDGVVPDFLTVSKTLGGGVPLAAAVTSGALEETCYRRGFVHVTSHVSDPMPAAVGLAVLEVLRRERLAERALELGRRLEAGLRDLQQRYEVVGDVRGRGLLWGVELVTDRQSRRPDPKLGGRITGRCLELGLSMNIVSLPGLASVWRIAPPLTATPAEIDEGLAILDQAIRDCQ
ncbi:MAG: aspartate aminotransferase family protein [Geminicoccaceae bacterium]|nr:aspartate aminotransferase family protein [Geminicoccaceae bacterium]